MNFKPYIIKTGELCIASPGGYMLSGLGFPAKIMTRFLIYQHMLVLSFNDDKNMYMVLNNGKIGWTYDYMVFRTGWLEPTCFKKRDNFMNLDQFIQRGSELFEQDADELINLGYNKIIDTVHDEEYYYSPIHWKHVNDDEPHDYMFDDIPFVALTNEARELAKSEGF